ncbi:MAG: DMT family transporter [Bdellovibrionales bacterium]|nr:DMT family transporter [Bdellovibrionales bacterium]
MQDQLGRSLFWMCLSAFFFSLMSLMVRWLSAEVPHATIVFFRSFTNFVISLILAWTFFRSERWHRNQLPLLIFRGLMGFIAVTCLFYAIQHIPLALSTLINWSSPVFVILFSWIFLKEKTSVRSIPWIVLSFLGLISLVYQPEPTATSSVQPINQHALMIAWLGSAFAAAAYISVRAAATKIGVNTIILFFSGIGSLLGLPWMWVVMQSSAPLTMLVTGKLVLMGLLATCGQYCMTQGYRFSSAGKVSSMGLLNAAFGAIWGWTFFSEVLTPFQWFGAILIVLGVVGVAGIGVSRKVQVDSTHA